MSLPYELIDMQNQAMDGEGTPNELRNAVIAFSHALELVEDCLAFVGSEGDLCLNMNDTFNYGADCEPIKVSDYEEVIGFYDRFSHYGLIAWVAYKRGTEPLDEIADCEEYKLARQGVINGQ